MPFLLIEISDSSAQSSISDSIASILTISIPQMFHSHFIGFCSHPRTQPKAQIGTSGKRCIVQQEQHFLSGRIGRIYSPEKVSRSILRNREPDSKVTNRSWMHPWKQSKPMTSTDAGITISTNPDFHNAHVPIRNNPEPDSNVTEVSDLHCTKQL
jgi:hypothetical protein